MYALYKSRTPELTRALQIRKAVVAKVIILRAPLVTCSYNCCVCVQSASIWYTLCCAIKLHDQGAHLTSKLLNWADRAWAPIGHCIWIVQIFCTLRPYGQRVAKRAGQVRGGWWVRPQISCCWSACHRWFWYVTTSYDINVQIWVSLNHDTNTSINIDQKLVNLHSNVPIQPETSSHLK